MVRRAILVLSAGLAIAGCGGGGGGETEEPGAVAAAFQGPIRSTDVEHGQELFDSICMSCHGGGAPDLAAVGWEPGAMRQHVRRGHGRMPAISESRLNADDLEAILAYMVTIDAVQGPPLEPSVGGEDAPPVEGVEPGPS